VFRKDKENDRTTGNPKANTRSLRKWLVAAVLFIAAAGWWFLRSDVAYVNFPPTAAGPWVAFGDSLTEGFGATEGNDYPAVLGRKLGVSIRNLGKSGETTSEGLNRVEEVARMEPRVVLLCFGGNDSLNQESRKQTFVNLARIIDRLHQVGSFVVLIGIRSASLRDYNEEHFAKLARDKRVLYLPDMLRGLAFKPVYMSDAIHPNDAGYEKIAERLEKKLKPLIGRLEAKVSSALSRFAQWTHYGNAALIEAGGGGGDFHHLEHHAAANVEDLTFGGKLGQVQIPEPLGSAIRIVLQFDLHDLSPVSAGSGPSLGVSHCGLRGGTGFVSASSGLLAHIAFA